MPVPGCASRQLSNSLTRVEKSGWQQTSTAKRPPMLSPTGMCHGGEDPQGSQQGKGTV